MRALERAREDGNVLGVDQNWTVAQWLTHWVENIAAPSVRPSTLSGYRVAVNIHLIPALGAHRLIALRPEHLERAYQALMRKPLKSGKPRKPATVHQAHRTMRTALSEAVRRGYLTNNPATHARAPRIVEEEIEPYGVPDIQTLLRVARQRRNSARWAIALALGLRQGEALGLLWADVDLDGQLLRVRRSRVRPQYAHSCNPPCGHEHPGHCPSRRQTNADTDETKSAAGKRTVGLPSALVALLRQHQKEQNTEREQAGQLWTECGWVFATPTGSALIPRSDWDAWKQLLRDAGLRDARLHDARHTAATVLLLLGVSERAMMGIMGWSNPAMARRYAHMVDAIHHDIAGRVDGLLWSQDDDAQPPEAGVPRAS
ncbi:tyrosine-type recombinase/integrase [Pengzhenrongella sp.]|uniref:tyrosine-type recombinase/integrase n=1 Tax=Pengzhenrongella sp. TaxID=2888820 RepID=UPI002F95427E